MYCALCCRLHLYRVICSDVFICDSESQCIENEWFLQNRTFWTQWVRVLVLFVFTLRMLDTCDGGCNFLCVLSRIRTYTRASLSPSLCDLSVCLSLCVYDLSVSICVIPISLSLCLFHSLRDLFPSLCDLSVSLSVWSVCLSASLSLCDKICSGSSRKAGCERRQAVSNKSG